MFAVVTEDRRHFVTDDSQPMVESICECSNRAWALRIAAALNNQITLPPFRPAEAVTDLGTTSDE